MGAVVFLVIYAILLIVMVIFEVYILSNDKSKYLNISYKSLKTICERLCVENTTSSSKELANELNRFYNEYTQEMPQLKRFYSNVVIWIDAIIFRIDSGNQKANVLKQYIQALKEARDLLEAENPFSKCEKYQQSILCDIEKMRTPENEILAQNIISRTEEEFFRLSTDIKKNNRLNVVSIAIGIIGIVVSVLMAIIKF